MLKKIKKRFSYLLGAVLAFVFSRISFATSISDLANEDNIPMYGPGIDFEPAPSYVYDDITLWEKISTIFLPLVITMIVLIYFCICIIIYFKKKKKNAKKD